MKHHRLSIPRGTVLFHAGQECSGFVVVHSGSIKVSLTAENGREIILYRVRPGEICLQTFGCLVNGTAYSAEGMAETDLEIDIIPVSEFQHSVAQDDAFRSRLFAAVAARFADLERLVEDVALTGFDARLARTLLRLADADGAVAATHEALAMEMGSGRAAVSRGLAQFAAEGLVEMGRGVTRIVARDRLEVRAHEFA